MNRGILQASVEDRGLVLDPRTKLALLITMTIFVLGYAGGEELAWLMPALCGLPAVFLITAKRYNLAIGYILIYVGSSMVMSIVLPHLNGVAHFLLFATLGILMRFLPCVMTGSYLISTTTVSEFMAAMDRLHMPQTLTIPLSVMFRFFPTVFDEWNSISSAMKMRGIRFGGKQPSKMLEYRFIPLLTCCEQIGEELSAAALTRGLGSPTPRTNVCEIGFNIQDLVVLSLCTIPYIALLVR